MKIFLEKMKNKNNFVLKLWEAHLFWWLLWLKIETLKYLGGWISFIQFSDFNQKLKLLYY